MRLLSVTDRTGLAVYRDRIGHIAQSILVPADFDGDGRADVAV